MNVRRQVQSVYFWQPIVTPHMAGLAAAMAEEVEEVVYVAEHIMSARRANQGWTQPSLGAACLKTASTAAEVDTVIESAHSDAIHICGGLRANGLIGAAQRGLAARRRKQWVVMETVDDAGWWGVAKRMNYNRLFVQWRASVEGVLAIGYRTPDWIGARGMPANRVFRFAYFLPSEMALTKDAASYSGPFRFTFAGRLVELKRVDMLLAALAALKQKAFVLDIIGAGPLEGKLRRMAAVALPGRIQWSGRLPMGDVHRALAHADCIVLPSRHDGWGAVVSEALMVGTQAICSDACGAAGVVKASRCGEVFRSGDVSSLIRSLEKVLMQGKVGSKRRLALANWAQCLGATAGSRYLKAILERSPDEKAKPAPPWEQL